MKTLLFTLSIMFFSSSTLADCYLDGKPYPTGTVVSGLTCQVDGSWR